MSDSVAILRAATNALELIRRRDPRAWAIAEQLAEMDVTRCLTHVLKARGPAPAFVPTTEAELVELFGDPGAGLNRPRRRRASVLLPAPTKREQQADRATIRAEKPRTTNLRNWRSRFEQALTECAP